MQQRRLGQNGPLVAAVGIGAMSFTDFYGPTSEAASHQVLETALELGLEHIDTANVYGMGLSERVIGSFLRGHGRNPFVIATKAGIRRDPETGARSFDNSRDYLSAELDRSLERLGVDQIELFYVHRRDQRLPIEAVTETLASFIEDSRIKRFGFSEIAPSSLRRASTVHPVAAVQSEYSLATRAPELGLVQACRDLGTTLVAFSPVARGLLTDHRPTAETVAQSAFLAANPRFAEPHLSANLRAAGHFAGLAAELGVPAASLAIAWLLARGDHVLPIPGTRSAGHLRELAQGMQLALGPDDLARIERTLPVGWAHGDRYSQAQWIGPERYC